MADTKLKKVLDDVATTNVALTQEVEGLRQYGKRSRFLIHLLTGSLILDVILTVALGFVGVEARNASIKAQTATSAAKVSANNLHVICESGNAARKTEQQLWGFVLSLPQPPQPGQTKAQKAAADKQRTAFINFLHTAFAPRKC